MRQGQALAWMVMLCIGSLLWAVSLNAQPEDILLDNHSVFTSRSRPAVEFPHMLHLDDAAIECSECHHRFKDGENIVDEMELYEGADGVKCSACHKSEPGFRLKPDLDPTQRTLRQAYHKMCTGCHRQVNREDEKVAPVTCGGCHPKKKESPT